MSRIKAQSSLNKIKGTASQPRLTMNKTNKNFYIQLINDSLGITLVHSSTLELVNFKHKMATNKNLIILLAEDCLQQMRQNNINYIIFDRNYLHYHGKVKMFLDTLKMNGIKFSAY